MDLIKKLQEVNQTVQSLNVLVQSLSAAADTVIEFKDKISKIGPIFTTVNEEKDEDNADKCEENLNENK